jgi:hypothetical protein
MHRLHHLSIGCLLALAARPAPSMAQSDSRLWAPAVVADSFFRATRDARWRDAARFMDLDAMSAIRDQSVRAARRQRPVSVITAETLIQQNPKMPREVAEYEARQANERSADFDPLAYEYAKVPSVDSLARLRPADVAARWLEARDPRWGIRRGLLEYQKRGCISADSVEVMVRTMRPGPPRIIGTVIDDSLAYVLHERSFLDDPVQPTPERARSRRRRMPGAVMLPPSVAMLRRVTSEWRIIPSYDPGVGTAVPYMSCPALGTHDDR